MTADPRVRLPREEALIARMEKQAEHLCQFNCDSESACMCGAHQMLRACLVALRAHQEERERLLVQLGGARGDVARMASAKIGDKCEHHKEPLAVLEYQALRECPICWKQAAQQAEVQLAAHDAALAEMRGTPESRYVVLMKALEHRYPDPSPCAAEPYELRFLRWLDTRTASEAARTLLLPYVQHKVECRISDWEHGPGVMHSQRPDCTCGLAALSSGPPAQEKKK